MEIFAAMIAVLVPAAWIYGLVERALKRRKARDEVIARRLSKGCGG
jgi:hypothetical protein